MPACDQNVTHLPCAAQRQHVVVGRGAEPVGMASDDHLGGREIRDMVLDRVEILCRIGRQRDLVEQIEHRVFARPLRQGGERHLDARARCRLLGLALGEGVAAHVGGGIGGIERDLIAPAVTITLPTLPSAPGSSVMRSRRPSRRACRLGNRLLCRRRPRSAAPARQPSSLRINRPRWRTPCRARRWWRWAS